MAAGTESDQESFFRDATAAMVNGKTLPSPAAAADLAGIAVPVEDPGTQAGKVDPVPALPRVAGKAEPAFERPLPPTLPTPQGGLAVTYI